MGIILETRVYVLGIRETILTVVLLTVCLLIKALNYWNFVIA